MDDQPDQPAVPRQSRNERCPIRNERRHTERRRPVDDAFMAFVHVWGLIVTDIVDAGYDPETVHDAWCEVLLARETDL